MTIAGICLQYTRGMLRETFTKCREITHTMFHKHLLATNVGISAALSCAGDILQQQYEMTKKREGKGRGWDRSRTSKMTLSGITVGVLCHYWYCFLDARLPGRTFRTVMKKVVIDQMVCSPMYITLFFATTCYVEKATLSQFRTEVWEKGWRLFLADWVVWPPAQTINFYILPPRYRVLYDNTISLGYDVYTSYVKHEIPLKDEAEDE